MRAMVQDCERRFRVACVQMCTGRDVAENAAMVASRVAEAAAVADFVLTPEMSGLMDCDVSGALEKIVPEKEDITLAAVRAVAASHQRWVLIGSLSVRIGPRRAANRSYLVAPDGSIRARYDKIHMFDVNLPGRAPTRESDLYQAGNTAVVAALPWGTQV